MMGSRASLLALLLLLPACGLQPVYSGGSQGVAAQLYYQGQSAVLAKHREWPLVGRRDVG